MRNRVPDGGTVEGISFFILCIELSTSQTDTISPKLRLECGISHMHGCTPAAHFEGSPRILVRILPQIEICPSRSR